MEPRQRRQGCCLFAELRETWQLIPEAVAQAITETSHSTQALVPLIRIRYDAADPENSKQV